MQGGLIAWRRAATPLIPADMIPASHLWVTRHWPKIDRIACPWLVRRFVDQGARFLYVAPTEVLDVADRFDATPFDVENAFWSHRGDNCIFDAILGKFNLHTQALYRMAQLVRAADTGCHDLAPQAAGLLAISVGLSRQHKHDTQQLQAGLPIYDALYRWARDGFEETHDCPTGRNP